MIPSPGTEKREPSLPNLQADEVSYCALPRRTGAGDSIQEKAAITRSRSGVGTRTS